MSALQASGAVRPVGGGAARVLPNFCSLDALFAVVVIGELLAFVLVLRPGSGMIDLWYELALTSLFIQWVGLSCAGALCVLHRRLAGSTPIRAALLAYAVVVALIACLSEAAYLLVASGFIDHRLHAGAALSDTVFWLTQQPLVALDLNAARHLDFLFRTTAIGAIVSAVALRYMHVQFQWQRNLESEANARVEALRARIRPHFLFNSMNTIASFTRSQPELAEQVVEDLSDLFRVSLREGAAMASLDSELDLARGYLRIEALRLGARLTVEWDVDGVPLDVSLPTLSLQPLVENAVYHGIEPADQGGTVRISGRSVDAGIRIEVLNSLPGGPSTRSGHRVAQANVRERLEAAFGPRTDFTVRQAAERYSVAFTIPQIGPERPGVAP